jgi:hypothetical protein
VRFRKPIEREGTYVLDYVFLGGQVDAVRSHSSPQLAFEILHAFPGASHSYRPAQLLCLRAREVRNRHRHAKKLLLKKWHAQGPL